MQVNENIRFIILTLGTFFLMFGTALLFFSAFEQVFFDLDCPRSFIKLVVINLMLGSVLIWCCLRKSA